MIPLPMTIEMLSSAMKMASQMGEIKESITGGRGNIAGFLGEICLSAAIGSTRVGEYNHDLILQNGEMAEVKTIRRNITSLRSVKSSWIASVAKKSMHQRPDIYIFCCMFAPIKSMRPRAYVHEKAVLYYLGHCSRKHFLKYSVFVRAGEYHEGKKNFKDKYNIKFSQLKRNIYILRHS